MSAELSIFKLFCDDRQLYDSYFKYVFTLKNLERELKLVARLIADFYDKYNTTTITNGDLLTFFDVQYPNNKDRHLYREIITSIFETDANPLVARDLLEQVLEKYYATMLLSKLIPVSEGNKYNVLPGLAEDLKEYISLMKNPPQSANELACFEKSVDELVSLVYPEGGLNWICPTLTRTIGPLMRQTLGVIFAYVDSGKTSFGVSNFVNFALQLKDTSDTIIYAGNEEAASRIAFRMIQAIMKESRQDIVSHTSEVSQSINECGWSRIKLFDNITTTIQVEKLLETYHPSLLFLDQGTKLTIPGGSSETSDTQALQSLFNFYREQAKVHNVAIVCLSQAVGEAENKKWLKLSDMYGSRVSIQGELDYAIGIGRVLDDPTKENIRYIHVSKNKLLDGASAKFMTHFIKEKCGWQEI